MATADSDRRHDRIFLITAIPAVLLLVWGSCHCVSLWRGDRGSARPESAGATADSARWDPQGYLAYLKEHGTDVQRDFATGVFRAGDPVEKLLAAHKPAFRVSAGNAGVVVFRPPEPDEARGRTVIVLSENGKLKGAETDVEPGPGRGGVVCFFPLLSVSYGAPLGADRWEKLANSQHQIDAMMAVLGCPIVCGELRRAGWWPE